MKKSERQYRKELKDREPKGGSNYDYELWREEKPERDLLSDGRVRK